MVSAGGKTSKEVSQKTGRSGTLYPGDFISSISDVIGKPASMSDVIGALPRSQSLFGGGQAAPPATATPNVPGADTGSAAATSATAGERRFTPGDIAGLSNNPDIMKYLQPSFDRGGGSLSMTDLENMVREGGTRGQLIGSELYGAASAQQKLTTPTASPLPGAAAQTDPNAYAGGTQASLGALGFGQTPTTATAPGSALSGVGTINAPVVGGDYNTYARELFKAQYDPVAREINRQGELSDKALQSQLAGAGLASSGAGVGQMQRQGVERSQQLQSAATDAASRSAAQAFTLKQEAALANAGFSMDAQKQNAANVLTGNTVNADNYLKTIGLNQDAATKARQDFLGLLNIQEADLARMDKTQLDSIALVLDNWLKQFAAVTEAGQYTTEDAFSMGKSRSGNVGILS